VSGVPAEWQRSTDTHNGFQLRVSWLAKSSGRRRTHNGISPNGRTLTNSDKEICALGVKLALVVVRRQH